MKKFNRNLTVAAIILVASLVLGLAGPTAVFAVTSPSLGAANTFGILSGTFTPATGTTAITGDLGYTILSAGLYTVTGATYIGGGIGNATYVQAETDVGNALTALNLQTCPAENNLGVIVDLSLVHGGVYTPGVYCSTGAMSIGTAGITLNGAGTYNFRAVGALTSVVNSVVTLANGASSCDVFWTPTAATTLGATTTFMGTVIDNANAITVGANTTWIGRALSLGAGVVTTHTADTINSTCAAAPVSVSVPPSSGGYSSSYVPRVVPVIGILKVPSSLALPAGSGSVTYNYTVWNVAGQRALTSVTVADDKCSPVVLLSGDLNGNGKLDPGEYWKYGCTTTLSKTTTNTATATGYSDDGFRQAAIATAISTVAVGTPLPPPLINIVKVPSRLTPFLFGGGEVTYTYTVTNPGVVAMHNIAVTDDKCAPVSGPSGDTNGDNLLDPGEAWVYTCRTNVPVSTNNIATAEGTANGFTAQGYAFASVLVFASTPAPTPTPTSTPSPSATPAPTPVPKLPNTGIPPDEKSIPWNIAILAGIFAASILFYSARRKQII